ncbi:MAG: 3-dehydroquinate synthase [Bryobacteraceae bacterium]|nr:3-dehydroquinate synthase [Bryobacteraceae bacterium]
MPAFAVTTPQRTYQAIVERGCSTRAVEFLPAKSGRIFVVTERDLWQLHGAPLERALDGRPFTVLEFPGGEKRKRMAEVETLAERMVAAGGDRSSVVIAFGGGIVNDLGGFLAAIFMRGVPVIQIPTTLLAQVDAAVGGKTGANLVSGKNLVGVFHQPLAVLIDPDVLGTLPEREFRAGLYEILKCGIIRSPDLYRTMADRSDDVLAHRPETLDYLVAESVRIKAEVVTADEREGDLRRILNFGHTIGHALEAETQYKRFLHGEAVAFGMRAATHLARMLDMLPHPETMSILSTIDLYGPIPDIPKKVTAEALVARTGADKKTIQGKVHFVLPDRIGNVQVVAGIDPAIVTAATAAALTS